MQQLKGHEDSKRQWPTIMDRDAAPISIGYKNYGCSQVLCDIDMYFHCIVFCLHVDVLKLCVLYHDLLIFISSRTHICSEIYILVVCDICRSRFNRISYTVWIICISNPFILTKSWCKIFRARGWYCIRKLVNFNI